MEEILDLEGGKNKIKKRGRTAVILCGIGFGLILIPLVIGVFQLQNGKDSGVTPSEVASIIRTVTIPFLIGVILGIIGFGYSINAIRQKEVGKIKFVGLVGNGIIITIFCLLFALVYDIVILGNDRIFDFLTNLFW